MALKYTNTYKFDDPSKGVDQSVAKISSAFPSKAIRQALQGINNRVIGQTGFVGAAGTFGTVGAGLAVGSNAGTLQFANKVCYLIDGKVYTVPATNNMVVRDSGSTFGDGTQGTATFCYYLVSVGTDGTGLYVSKGNDSATLAGADLPDLPEQNAPVGYFKVNTIATTPFVIGTSTAGDTALFTVTYVDLFNMPIIFGAEDV